MCVCVCVCVFHLVSLESQPTSANSDVPSSSGFRTAERVRQFYFNTYTSGVQVCACLQVYVIKNPASF